MKSLSAALEAHIKGGVTTLATCVEVIRTDGKAFYFTDHDMPITIGTNEYLPNYGYKRSSIITTLNLEVDSFDMVGVMQGSDANAGPLADLSVTREDIDAGSYDFAVVYMFMVNWADVTMGTMSLRRGWLGEVESNEDGTYKAEVRGLSQVFAYRLGEAFSPDCRADLGDFRCKVALNPDPWAPNTGYLVGNSVLGVIDPADGYFNLSVVNGSFEEPLDIDPGPDVPGWVVTDGKGQDWSRKNLYFAVTPADGSFFIANVNAVGQPGGPAQLAQQVDLIAAGLTGMQLDTGKCRIYATFFACSNGPGSAYRIQIFPVTADGARIPAVFDTGQKTTTNTRFIQTICDNVLLPVGTRQVQIVLGSGKPKQTQQGSFFDGIIAAVNAEDGTFGSADQYGGVAFVAQQTGISGATAPAWSNVLGATFVDGTVVWKCVNSPKQVAVVTDVESDKAFTCDAVTQADGYFDDGVLVWETGDNAGRSGEVRTWQGGEMTLLFRPFHPIQTGDRFVVYPGCQKTRSICLVKFGNVINIRAEPDVPGQDKLMATPDVTSES